MSDRSDMQAHRAHGRVPDLSSELLLMTDDIKTGRARPVERRFAQLIDALEKVRARYAICGAVAMGAHGAERYTKEIDVLVDGNDLERTAVALAPALRELGREPAKKPPKQIRMRSAREPIGRSTSI